MRTNPARRATGATIALALTLAACSFNNGFVLDVTIDGSDRSVVVGDRLTLTATVTRGGGATDGVTWTSDDEAVATIDTDGRIEAAAAGTAEITATSTSDPSRSGTISLTVDPPGALRWTRQFGSTSIDLARGVATDANGNVYVTGHTDGALDGPNAGEYDAILRAYDRDGQPLWTHQFGTTGVDFASGVAADADGNAYVTGYTGGALDGPNAGESDAFLRAYDREGQLLWTRQFGAADSEVANGVATDTNGNVYVTGYTDGALEGPNAGGADAFLRAYDRDGQTLWTHQFGTSLNDFADGVATGADGRVYVTGTTFGALDGTNAGGRDAFLRAYDRDGHPLWTRQIGTSLEDFATGVATDAMGRAYVTGYTVGDLDGTSAGGRDAFLRAYDRDGQLLWAHQFGTTGHDVGSGIAVDANGHVHVAGFTLGDLGGLNAGVYDAFVRSYGR
jgi:hypothetical protein